MPSVLVIRNGRRLRRLGAKTFCYAVAGRYVRARQLARVVGTLHRGLGGHLLQRLSPLPAFFSSRPDGLLISGNAWQTHHALVLPSRVEGTPLAMVEAMLCARPVIGAAVAGIPEWVRHGRSGFIADAHTVSSYASALETAWQQRAQWRTIGTYVREDALRLYDPAPEHPLLNILTESVGTHKVLAGIRESATASSLDGVGRCEF
jgi:hypothetical protein